MASVTLADLHARNITLPWYEAVAIVQELCSVATQSSRGSVHVPELSGIAITDSGEVDVVSGPAQADAVGRAAHILSALLTDPEVPVKLRFLLVEATSATPQQTSVAHFSKDLDYFERPGRNHQIRVAYQRCHVAASEPAKPRVEAEAAEASQGRERPSEQDSKMPHQQRRRGRRTMAVALVAAAFAGGIAATLLWTGQSSVDWPQIAGPELLEQTRVAAFSGLEWATGQLGLNGEMPPTPEEDVLEVKKKPAAPPRRHASSSRVVAVPANELTVVAPSKMPMPVPELQAPKADPVQEPAEKPVPTRKAASGASVFYTSADREVQPPMVVYPQMPPDDELNPSRPDVASMQILVSETGSVLHVRMGPGPSRMSHFMFLSAAKAWRFQPALKDGEPVPYLITQRWATGR